MRCGNSLVPLMYLYTDGLHKVSPTETNEVKCILPFLSTWVNLCACVQEMQCESSSSLLYEDNCVSWQGAQWQLLQYLKPGKASLQQAEQLLWLCAAVGLSGEAPGPLPIWEQVPRAMRSCIQWHAIFYDYVVVSIVNERVKPQEKRVRKHYFFWSSGWVSKLHCPAIRWK